MAEIEKFHHYEVLRRDDGSLYELGRGAMGITYKAFDTNLRCTVALKVINGAYLNSEVARQRFVREARAAARLSHPNVAAIIHPECDPHARARHDQEDQHSGYQADSPSDPSQVVLDHLRRFHFILPRCRQLDTRASIGQRHA